MTDAPPRSQQRRRLLFALWLFVLGMAISATWDTHVAVWSGGYIAGTGATVWILRPKAGT